MPTVKVGARECSRTTPGWCLSPAQVSQVIYHLTVPLPRLGRGVEILQGPAPSPVDPEMGVLEPPPPIHTLRGGSSPPRVRVLRVRCLGCRLGVQHHGERTARAMEPGVATHTRFLNLSALGGNFRECTGGHPEGGQAGF